MIETIHPANEQDWLALRNKDITSTKVAALFGVSPYLTKFELWHQITRGEVVEFEENQRMKWGNRLQDSIASGIAEDQGWNIRKMTEYIRDTDIRAGSSFDFAIDEDGILEIKNVDGLVYRNSWDENSAPLHIELQVQHQLMVSGRKYAWIGALVGGNDLKLIRRERDEVVIESIRKAIKEFWVTIENNTPPEPDFQADADFLSKIYGFSEPGKLFDARGDEEIKLLAEEYKKLGDIAKDAENKRDAIKAELLTKIQDAEKVTGDGFSISAGMVGECPISYVRKAYRLFKLTWKKEK